MVRTASYKLTCWIIKSTSNKNISSLQSSHINGAETHFQHLAANCRDGEKPSWSIFSHPLELTSIKRNPPHINIQVRYFSISLSFSFNNANHLQRFSSLKRWMDSDCASEEKRKTHTHSQAPAKEEPLRIMGKYQSSSSREIWHHEGPSAL